MSFVNDDQALDYVQGQRKKLVESMLCDDGSFPSDNNDRNTMLRALEGIASTATASKRLKTDKDVLDMEKEAKHLLHQTMMLLASRTVKHDDTSSEPPRAVATPQQFSEGFTPVEGETDVGVSSETFEDFSKRHGLNT